MSERIEPFSVLISVYYKEKAEYLELALNSIFNQTLLPNEVVLVKDGELTKELENVITKFQNLFLETFKVISIEKNSGLGNALNVGIKECKNEYIARMDSDDSSNKDRFEKQMKFLSTHNNIDVLGCNIEEYDEQMKFKLRNKDVPEKNKDIKVYFKNRNPFNHPTVIFKKSSVEKAGGYSNCLFFEDYYLWAKLIKNGCQFYNMQEYLYKFRTSNAMYKRRGGFQYCKYIINFEILIYKLNLINKFEFINNITKRCIGAIIPNRLRKIIYENRYRNK